MFSAVEEKELFFTPAEARWQTISVKRRVPCTFRAAIRRRKAPKVSFPLYRGQKENRRPSAPLPKWTATGKKRYVWWAGGGGK